MLVILTIVGHLGWSFATPPMKHYFLDAKIREIVKEGRLLNTSDMMKEIMRGVEEKKIPVTEKDIHFKRDGNQLRISVAYSTTVTAPFYTKTYQFASNYSGLYDPR